MLLVINNYLIKVFLTIIYEIITIFQNLLKSSKLKYFTIDSIILKL